MRSTSVTSKGQITIPKQIRQQLGIRKGSKMEATIVGNHIELHISNIPSNVTSTGFAMLKRKRTAVPTDFDPASLLKKSVDTSLGDGLSSGIKSINLARLV